MSASMHWGIGASLRSPGVVLRCGRVSWSSIETTVGVHRIIVQIFIDPRRTILHHLLMARPELTPADGTFALFCEQGSVALALRDALASGRFLSPIDAMAAACKAPVVPSAPRIFTAYAPKAQRNAAAHGLYCAGIRTPRPRVTAADKALAEAKRWGLAS
jgi:hypothetical protein